MENKNNFDITQQECLKLVTDSPKAQIKETYRKQIKNALKGTDIKKMTPT